MPPSADRYATASVRTVTAWKLIELYFSKFKIPTKTLLKFNPVVYEDVRD